MNAVGRVANTSTVMVDQNTADETEQDYGTHRVRFFGLGDLSYHWQLERIEKLFSTNEEYRITSIDDAIEARECLSVLEIALTDGAKKEEHFRTLRNQATIATKDAYRYVKNRLLQDSISALYGEVCIWYREAFIRFVALGGLEEEITDEEFSQFLHAYPGALHDVLTQKKMVYKFDLVVRDAMIAYPSLSAELIISALASPSDRAKTSFHFPQGIKNTDIDLIFCAYAEHNRANLNYLKAIIQWRADWGYSVSPETKTAALERYQTENKKLLESGTAHDCLYGMVIGFDRNQLVCIKVGMEDDDPSFLFSGQWIEGYHDFSTLLNNFIFLFGFIGTNGLLEAGKPDRDRSVLLDLVGLRTKNEYREGIGQSLNRMREVGVLRAYGEVLSERGIEIEDLIEWYFNSYIVSEYSIEGFQIEIEREGSYLSKCRSIGPEIEKILKMYQLYSKERRITKEALHFEQFSSFQELLSRVQKKYVYGAGREYETACNLLFSDQCMLAYSPADSKSYKHFLDRLRNEEVNRNAIAVYCLDQFEWLIKNDFVVESTSTGLIFPTNKTLVTYRIWRDGCIVYQKEKEELLLIVDELLNEGYLTAESALLTEGEADYFSYVFHNRDYVNALALRNSYLHGESFDDDANSEIHRGNYELLLRLLIQLLLKLDDEFSQANPSGCKIEFIDWPMYEIGDDFRKTFGISDE